MRADMSFEERLREHFGAVESQPTPRGKGPAVAAAAGRRWVRRRRAGIAIGVLVAGTLAGLGVLKAIDSFGSDVPVADDGGDAQAPIELDWGAVSDGGLVGYQTKLSPVGEVVYAISTAPGSRFDQGMPPRHLYSSSDGLSWQPLGDLGLGAGWWTQELQGVGDTLYVVGTAPAAGAGTRASVFVATGTAEEPGEWKAQVLETGWPADTLPLEFSTTNVEVAVHEGTVVVAARSTAAYDLWNLLPAEITQRPDVSWETDSTGIRVIEWEEGEFDVNQTEVWSATWEELGVDGGDSNRAALWVSDGDGFEPITPPDLHPETWAMKLASTGDGFLLAASGSQVQVFRSVDGRTWDNLDVIPGASWVQAVGSVDGHPVVVAEGQQGSRVFARFGDRWESAGPETPPNTWTMAADVAGDRLALVMSAAESGRPSLMITDDLRAWRPVPILRMMDEQWIETVQFIGDSIWLAGSGHESREGSGRTLNLVAELPG